jgi:hypothetical protein
MAILLAVGLLLLEIGLIFLLTFFRSEISPPFDFFDLLLSCDEGLAISF